MEHYNVLIATPGRQMHAPYVKSLVKTVGWLESVGLTYKFLTKPGSFIPLVREMTALDRDTDFDTANALDMEYSVVGSKQYTYDKIFWIDSDIEWEIEDFKKLYESDLDIVSGMYALNSDGMICATSFNQSYYGRGIERPTPNLDEFFFFGKIDPIEVFGCGFGFIAVKSGVFETMDKPWFKIEHFSWDHLNYETFAGEDYSWCINARRSGYKTYVDPTVKLKHHKETVYLVN
jgi:hypothetical protein